MSIDLQERWQENEGIFNNFLIFFWLSLNISTLLTLLSRLIDRGFLSSEKRGRERIYYPQVEREEYMEYETKNFIKKLHKNSFMSLVNTLYDNNDLTEQDMDELSRWLEEKKQNQ